MHIILDLDDVLHTEVIKDEDGRTELFETKEGATEYAETYLAYYTIVEITDEDEG